MTTSAAIFEAVIFDMDGVLVESEHLWEENWVRYSGMHGYTWLASDTAMVQGMSVPEWARYLVGRIGSDDPDHIMEDIVANMIASLHNGRVELLPGSYEMVTTAAARVPVAVASSASFRFIEAVLEATGLRPSFSAVVSSEQVPGGKPAPDVYEEAARRIGVDPRRAIAIEDSSNGLRAAAAAGMHVIALPNQTYPPRPDALALCAKIATSADDVRGYLVEHLPPPR
ncbi:MAG: HAD family phosphatase [Thermomicrobiales bacterium]